MLNWLCIKKIMALKISTIKVENMKTDEEEVIQTTAVQISDSADVTEGSNVNVNNQTIRRIK